jgi:hypothetical protein
MKFTTEIVIDRYNIKVVSIEKDNGTPCRIYEYPGVGFIEGG